MKKYLYLLLLAVAGSFHVFAQITYVTVNGAGSRNGTSWSNAMDATGFRSVINMPPATANAMIWVAAGTYKPAVSARDSFFLVAPSVKIYGGFAGNETQLSQRNWTANVTTLSGDLGVQNDTSDNSYNIIRFETSQDAELDGFTITGGNASHPYNYYHRIGGGVLNICNAPAIYTSSPRIRNCRFRRNYAIEGGGGLCNISVTGLASPVLENCIFEENAANRYGGAIYSTANQSTLPAVLTGNTSIAAVHCTFTGNSTYNSNSFGGAVCVYNTGSVQNATLTACTFTENKSGALGGAFYYGTFPVMSGPRPDPTFIRIDSCVFTRNVSTSDGMAICGNYAYMGTTDMSITNSSFDANNSLGSYSVISLKHISSVLSLNRITGCRFISNKRGQVSSVIKSEAGYGGGGSPNGSGTDSLLVSNSFFYNNGSGTDIELKAMDGAKHFSTIANCTIFHDSATSSALNSIRNDAMIFGGSNVPLSTESGVRIQNSILWHYLKSYQSAAQMEIYSTVQGLAASAAHSSVTNSIVTGVRATGWPADYGTNGGNNSGLYPGFADTANMDFHLGCGSYGIDHGNNGLIAPAGLTKDVAGGPRIRNSIVDIGAFESDLSSLQPRAIPVGAVSGATLTYSYGLPADSVRWTFGDGGTSTAFSGTHTYQRSGTYTVCLHIKNNCGSDDSCFQRTVVVPTAVSNVSNDAAITLYPNPVSDQLHIKDIDARAALTIYNMAGTQVYACPLPASKEALIDVTQLAAGNYLLLLQDAHGLMKKARFVKR